MRVFRAVASHMKQALVIMRLLLKEKPFLNALRLLKKAAG